MQMSRQHLQRLFQLSTADPLLESPVAGLVRRIFLRQLAPLRSRAQHPEHTVQHGAGFMPRTAAVVLPPSRSQHRFHNCPLFVSQFPASCHGTSRLSQSSPRITRNHPSGIYETGSSLWLSAALFSAAQHTGVAQTTALSDVQTFQQIEDRWSNAINTRDQRALELVLSPELTDISAAGNVTTRTQEIAVLHLTGAEPISVAQCVANVRTFGDVAIVVGTYLEQLRVAGTPLQRRGLFTHVYQRARGSWFCVSSHRTAIAVPVHLTKQGPKPQGNVVYPPPIPMLNQCDRAMDTQPMTSGSHN
jgi:ketosteroid isomerase-like protein